MSSIRHNDDAVLDAARACVLSFGVRRTTLTEVARRAGVSRMTLYRRWPDIATLVGDLLTREAAEVVESTRPAAGARGSARARLVDHLVAATGALRGSAVFRRILEVDPELLLPYLLDRLGASQRAAIALLEGYVADGQADGSVRSGDPSLLTRSLLLPVQSYLLSAQVYGDGSAERLAEELRHMLDAHLRPEMAA